MRGECRPSQRRNLGIASETAVPLGEFGISSALIDETNAEAGEVEKSTGNSASLGCWSNSRNTRHRP